MTGRGIDERALDRVLAALAGVVPDLAPLPEGGWGFTLANGRPVGVRARSVYGEWLELTTHLKGVGPIDASNGWRLLALNARLTGAARVASSVDGGMVLRSEAAIVTDGERTDESSRRGTDIGDAVRWLCDDFRTALCQVHDTNEARFGDAGTVAAHESAVSESMPDGVVATQIAALCTEAGWTATARASGDVAVRVETRHATYQASLSLGAGDSFQALVPFGDVEPTLTESRAAAARLLLVLSGAVRLVKGVAVCDGATVRPGIAAACAPPRTGADMARILSALSVACGLSGREIGALVDPEVARAYLALAGSDAANGGHTKTDEPAKSHDSHVITEKERICL